MTSQEYMAMGHRCPGLLDFAIMVRISSTAPVTKEHNCQLVHHHDLHLSRLLGLCSDCDTAQMQFGDLPGSYLWGSQSPDWGSGRSRPPLGAIHTSFPPLLISFTIAPSVRLFVACIAFHDGYWWHTKVHE